MAVCDLKIDVRRNKILDILQRDGQVRVSQLSKDLGMTVVTIRSDLDALERDGYLERVQGGAIQSIKNYHNLEFLRRKQVNSQIKQKIAASASGLVADGSTIFINSGTTTYYTALELRRHKGLSIVTNSLLVAEALGAFPTFRVILLGGEINAQYSFTYGSDTLEQLQRYKADFVLLSMDGVCLTGGLTTYHAEEAVVNRLMMDRANSAIVVADSNKLDKEGFSFVSDIQRVHTLVTDSGCNKDFATALRDMGIQVVF